VTTRASAMLLGIPSWLWSSPSKRAEPDEEEYDEEELEERKERARKRALMEDGEKEEDDDEEEGEEEDDEEEDDEECVEGVECEGEVEAAAKRRVCNDQVPSILHSKCHMLESKVTRASGPSSRTRSVTPPRTPSRRPPSASASLR